MKVCDRCKRKIDTEVQETIINGERVEICSLCASHILNHIRTYQPKQEGVLSKIVKSL